MKRTFLHILLAAVFLLALAQPTPAQAKADGPVYVVQAGDSLTSISQAFHTTPTRILLVNSVANADVLSPGTKLVIPGFEDLSGTLTRVTIGLGDTPSSLMRQSHSDPSAFTRINFLTSPGSIYVGQSLYTLSADSSAQARLPLVSGLTDLELAALNNVSPWAAAESNDLVGRWDLVANDTLYLPSTAAGDILPGITALSITPSQQGQTTVALATGSAESGLGGSLHGYTLHFFPSAANTLQALQGIPRMQAPGPVDLVLTTTDSAGKTFSIQQRVLVYEVTTYGFDAPLQVADNFVDPAITEPEMAQVFQITAPAPPEKLWSGAFQYPVSAHDCQPSTFGRLRSLNGSDYIYFHSGIDFCGSEETPIYAAADGVVVFAGPLTVRGNATIISHGQGVYTGYWHQSRIDVTVGQKVTAGEPIGMVGATGRVTGPHLHFEVLVGDVQVDPIPWLAGFYP